MCVLYLPGLKIITTVGDSSSLWKPSAFLVHKPDQFLMPFLTKEMPNTRIQLLVGSKEKAG